MKALFTILLVIITMSMTSCSERSDHKVRTQQVQRSIITNEYRVIDSAIRVKYLDTALKVGDIWMDGYGSYYKIIP